MKLLLYSVLLCLFISFNLQAQPGILGNRGNTYALLVGISDYADDRISDLNFADKDAQIFSDYLQSAAGGSVPKSNIVLLTNEAATNAAMHEAFRMLKKKVQKNDKVIFYFSGHGDVESEEFNPLGYLLAYNTPYNNYETNAMQMSYLNRSAATLTLREGREAEVVFYIDACHAGELAGSSNNGTVLAARELKKKAANEVRMMSCAPEQKSIETTKYGGGRGLFSYFLIKGLIGEADGGNNPDLQISKRELERYLQDNVEEASRNIDPTSIQSPEASGNDQYSLAFVDDNIFSRFKTEAIAAFSTLGNSNRTGTSNSPGDILKNKGVSEDRNIKVFDDIEFAPFDEALAANNLLGPGEGSAYEVYQKVKKSNRNDERLDALKSKLLIALQDEAQKAINAYLRGDQAELDRRIYINKSKAYEQYPTYLAKAAELAGKDHPSYKDIKAKQYYFEGINYRLKNMVYGLSKKHLRTAMNLQKKAMEYDANTAFINNELGVLHLYVNEFDKAGPYYQKAMEIAPTWVVPYSNYCIMQYVEKKYEDAEEWGLKAMELQPDYLKSIVYVGLLQETKEDYLNAERLYRKAIQYHWDNHLGFEKLAYLYTLLGKYPLADHLFLEMELRKAGAFPTKGVVSDAMSDAASATGPVDFLIPSEADLLERIRKNPKDDKAWLELGQLYELERRFEEAETCFLEVIELKPQAYFVYELLGDLYASWQKEDMYRLVSFAISSMSIDTEGNVTSSADYGPSYNGSRDTIIRWPTSNWKRYEDALAMYKVPIDSIHDFSGVANSCATKIWTLQEELERNEEAEDIMELYIWEHNSKELLENFYGRMVDKYPNDPDYRYKRGMWYYDEFQPCFGEESYNCSAWFAIDDFEAALELDSLHPSRADMQLRLGKLYAYEANQKHLATFVKENMKENLQDSSQFQVYQLFLEYSRKALAYTEASNAHRPDQTGPQYQLADQYVAFFKPNEALAVLETLADSSRLSFETRRQLIHVYSLTGQQDKAGEVLDWLLQKPIGLELEDHMEAGIHFTAKKDYTRAIQHFEKVLEFDPDNTNIQYQIATLYARDQKTDLAFNWLEKAFKNGFNYKKILYYDPNLDSLRKSGKYSELISNYKLQADPDNKALLEEG